MRILLFCILLLELVVALPAASWAEPCAPWPPARSGALASTADAPGAGYEFSEWACERPLVEAPFLELGPDAEPWLPRFIDVLDRNRPPHYAPDLVALLAPPAGDPYLIVKWRHDDPERWYRPLWPLELHKVIRGPDGGRRVKWLRRYRGEAVALLAPTGQALTPGGPPVALLSRYIGGSSVGSLELRLIEMARNSVDITPDWAGRLIDVVDLDADGHYEAVVDDSPWNLKIHHQSIRYSPFVPVILARRDGRFVRACRDYPGAYDSFIRENLRRARGSGDHTPTALSTAFFAYLQIGAFAEARALLDQFERAMGFFLGAFAWTGNLEAFPTPEQIREDHQDVLEAIARNPDVACPSSVPGLPAGRHRYLRPYDESERNRVRRR